MSERHRLRDYDRERAVRRLEIVQSVTTVASAMGVSKSVISRLKKATEGGNALRKHAGGRGRNITPLEDHYVAFMATPQKFHSRPDSYKPCNRYRKMGHQRDTQKSPMGLWLSITGLMFSDESRFSVTSDSGHQLMWKERGTRYAQKFVCVNGMGKAQS
ncbi:hypothetical protein TNCV_1593591 [Trichonephila clavipes]|nr:hypothetical protein TNCV_1593591 [Trichonephila clavipes]